MFFGGTPIAGAFAEVCQYGYKQLAAEVCFGIVTLRQQPDTVNGTIFVSLEDEFGATQVIVWRDVREAQREVLLRSRLLAVKGRWQRQGMVCNLIAERLADLSPLLGRLQTESRNFR